MMRLRSFAACMIIAAAILPAYAQNLPENVRIDGQYVPLGYCQLTSLSSATLLSTCSDFPTNLPQGVTFFAEICSESVALRYRDDGVAPTSTVGMPINTNTCFQYNGPLSAFEVIQGASGGVLDVSFYK